VTFHPDEIVADNFRAMVRECGSLIVVDNGSEAGWRESVESMTGVEIIANPSNVGVATALNQGMRRAGERGFSWVLAFDQDSSPEPGFCEALWQTLLAHPDSARVAVVGANICETVEGGRKHRWLCPHPWLPGAFAKVPLRGHDLLSVTMAITSGSLLRTADFAAVGPFADEFFIDYVDTDYCLRCREGGRLIAVSHVARLAHSFGARDERRWLGLAFTPTNHTALRHYYIARNRIAMIRRHAFRQFHWFLFDLANAWLLLVRALAVEDRKADKFRAMLLGTWDGLLGRLGPCRPGRFQ
jgi:rhamnosyltransferase